MMAWHSFISNKHQRRKRAKNFEENLEGIRDDDDE